MHLQNLSLINFKNYSQGEFEFSPKINCFTGNNGSGKTNLLDAIHYLSFCKSFFNPIDSQNIRHNEDFFVVQGSFMKNDQAETVYCGQKNNQKKQFKRNKKEYSRIADHIGLFPLVMVSPTDVNLILEGSEERRRFLDSVISQFDRNYLENLINYNKALNHRNKLLKDFVSQNYMDTESLEIWDDQLVSFGNLIYRERLKFLDELLPVFQKYYDFISTGNEPVQLIYHSQIHDRDFAGLMKGSVQKDMTAQFTTTGIHKDDLLFYIAGYPMKKTGSQGQQKTYLTALKLAQFEFIKKINGFNPILLLDDIFDKLDATRVKQIIKLVAEDHFGQIFITDANKERIDKILIETGIDYKIFSITNGSAES